MMKTLETLIKRAKRTVDELSTEATRALETRNAILAEQAANQAALEAESSLIDGSPLAGMGFAAYLDKQKARAAELDEAMDLADKAHRICKDELAKAFAELKKLEFLLAQEKIKARVAAEKTEQAGFDERSSQMFGRKRP